MEFPLKSGKIDRNYMETIEYNADIDIIARYSAFKNGSNAIVTAFKNEKNKYGSIRKMPKEILLKYITPLNSLLVISRNLRSDLFLQANRNTKDLGYIRANGDEQNFINEIALKKRASIFQKIEHIDELEMLAAAIEFCIEKNRPDC